MIQIYSLRHDHQTINAIQEATIWSDDAGLLPEHGLFGSKEWWQAIDDGIIEKHEVTGKISSVYMSGHNDWPEFEIDEGYRTSQWTREVSDVPGRPLTREAAHRLYERGRSVRIVYVRQRFKKPLPHVGKEAKNVLEIWIDDILESD